jgi:hypothetical protein
MVMEENRLPHPNPDAPGVTIENRIWGVKRQSSPGHSSVVSGLVGLSAGDDPRGRLKTVAVRKTVILYCV